MRRCRSRGLSIGLPSTSMMMSPGRRPADSAGLPLMTSTTSRPLPRPTSAGPARRDRAGDPGDAEVRAPDPPVADQGADDPLGGRVDRNGKTEAGARKRGVDPDDATRRIGERTPRVAGIERGVGLDHVVDDPDLGAGPRGQRPAEGAHDARRDAAGKAERIADGHHQLTNPKRRRVAELRGLKIAVFGDQHREVGERVPPLNAEAKLAPVGEVEPAAVAPGDHVRRGDQVAVGAQRNRRATPERGAAPRARGDLHRRDRRRERRGYLGERARVRVERLAVIARVRRHRDLRPAPSGRQSAHRAGSRSSRTDAVPRGARTRPALRCDCGRPPIRSGCRAPGGPGAGAGS